MDSWFIGLKNKKPQFTSSLRMLYKIEELTKETNSVKAVFCLVLEII